MPRSLSVIPVRAPVQTRRFDLCATLLDSLRAADVSPREGDVVAVSSKYASIAAGRIRQLDTVQPTAQARQLAARYGMDAGIAQLVIDEAEHIFGGIELGFLLTAKGGVISPNAGLDRSNIPGGQVALLPRDPFKVADDLRACLQACFDRRLGVLLSDSWLMPGRYGTTSVAIAMSGFLPIRDERGKSDLFGNPMAVTQIGLADSLAVCAQMVMGERDEATPFAIVRGADITLCDKPLSAADVAIPWRRCIYIESLTVGMLRADSSCAE